MNVIFHTVAGEHSSGEFLDAHVLDVVPDGQHKVYVKDHLYIVLGHEWHMDGARFEAPGWYIYPPYVIVKLA